MRRTVAGITALEPPLKTVRRLPVWIVDEAQNPLPDGFRDFPALLNFVNFACDSRDLRSVWLVGHPVLAQTLRRAPCLALAGRMQASKGLRRHAARILRSVMRLVLVLAVASASAQVTTEVQVVQIPLGMSNVHLIKSGKRCFLVDTPSKEDLPAHAAALHFNIHTKNANSQCRSN